MNITDAAKMTSSAATMSTSGDRVAEVPAGLDECASRIAAIEETIEMLVTRLDPILRQHDTRPSGDEQLRVPTQTKIGGALDTQAYRLGLIGARLQDLYDRAEL